MRGIVGRVQIDGDAIPAMTQPLGVTPDHTLGQELARTITPAPIAGFHRFRRPGPSLAELRPAADRVPAAVAGPPEHRQFSWGNPILTR